MQNFSTYCSNNSSYLIEGNLWTFGKNWLGLNSDYQLGKLPTPGIPTKINRLKDIQQISQGPCGGHLLAKSQIKYLVLEAILLDNLEYLLKLLHQFSMKWIYSIPQYGENLALSVRQKVPENKLCLPSNNFFKIKHLVLHSSSPILLSL